MRARCACEVLVGRKRNTVSIVTQCALGAYECVVSMRARCVCAQLRMRMCMQQMRRRRASVDSNVIWAYSGLDSITYALRTCVVAC